MKKLLLTLLVAATSLLADLAWVDYDKALEEAKKTEKLVMVMLGRENCPACEYMKDRVFADEKVLAEVNKHFIPVYLDIHNDLLPNGLSYIGTPTFHFMNAYEIKKGRIDGGLSVKDFLEEIAEITAK